MGKPVICKGDKTTHGGTVLEGLSEATVDGRQIAAIGHKVFCPLCRGQYPIVEGAQAHYFNGRNTAVAGMKTACGAALIPSQSKVTIEPG
jgi:uncharacterized Zn-binding protein involved in type VI secretion